MEKERGEAKEKAQATRLVAVAAGDQSRGRRMSWLRFKTPWRLQRRPGAGLRLRLPAWRLNELLFCWRSWQQNIKCPPSSPRPVKIKKPWRRTTRRLWSLSSPMDTDVVCLNTTFFETSHKFLTVCPTPLIHSLPNSSCTLGAPWPQQPLRPQQPRWIKAKQ